MDADCHPAASSRTRGRASSEQKSRRDLGRRVRAGLVFHASCFLPASAVQLCETRKRCVSRAPHVLTSFLADLHVVLEIASCEMDALAVRIARQIVPRVSTPKVRVRTVVLSCGALLTIIQLTPSSADDLCQRPSNVLRSRASRE
jgi:hypothetical protein